MPLCCPLRTFDGGAFYGPKKGTAVSSVTVAVQQASINNPNFSKSQRLKNNIVFILTKPFVPPDFFYSFIPLFILFFILFKEITTTFYNSSRLIL